MNASQWINRQIQLGQPVVLPAGEFRLDSTVVVPSGRAATIAGAGRDQTRLVVGAGAGFAVFANGALTMQDMTVDASFQPKLAVLRLSDCSLIRCRVLGGLTSCVRIEQPGSFEVDDLRIGAMSVDGPGTGYGLHVRGATTSGTKTIVGVQPHDLEMRHLITLQDNVNGVSVSNCSTPSVASFATLDLHGQNEGKAAPGSITATGCVGRFNVGNPTWSSGSHLTMVDCNLDGRQVWLYQNSQVRRQGVTGWSLVDNSSGTGAVIDI